MRNSILLLALLTAGLFSATAAEVRVENLHPANVIGLLGKPLGTRRVVSGVLAENVLLANPLAVTEVDGSLLKHFTSIEVRGKVQIRKGIRYRLEGYESGEFSGPPDWVAPQAQQPFQFRSFFVVTQVIETRPK